MSNKQDPITKDGDPDTTSSTETRWKYLGSVTAGITIVTLNVLMLGAATTQSISFENIGQSWLLLYGTVVLMAATWTWGEKTLKTVKNYRNSKQKK